MNLETEIKTELWQSIAQAYNAQNYTDSINAAMQYLTDILRDKSGLTSDGAQLVGEALGKKSPKIQINPLQTDTEKSMQAGLESVLRGMYGLVRNPRHHERQNDDKKTADAIIVFIDHLLDYLGKAKHSFTTEDFIETVTDEYFVSSPEYVKELISTIPVKKRYDVLVELHRSLSWKNADSVTLVSRELLKQLSESELDDYLIVISNHLGPRKVKTPSEVSLMIKLLPNDLWPRLNKIERMRAEHLLVVNMQGAFYNRQKDTSSYPEGTWLNDIAVHIADKKALQKVIMSLLSSSDFDQHNYIARFYLSYLPVIFGETFAAALCIERICQSIRNGNSYMTNQVAQFICDRKDDNIWRKRILKLLEDLTDKENPEHWLLDDEGELSVPFLGKPNLNKPFQIPGLQDEDIPF